MWMLFAGELRRRWAEILLGGLAIALVVATLVAQRTVTSSAESVVHDLAHRLGKNMLVLPASTDLEDFYAQRYGPGGLPDSTPSAILSSPLAAHIRAIEARLYGNAEVNGVAVIVVGQDLGWPSLGGLEPVVLGAGAARALSLAPGHTLLMAGTTFNVLYVAEAPPDGLEMAVFMPLAAAQRVLGRPGEIGALRLGGCWCRIDVATLAGEVEKLLPGTRAITVAGMLKAQTGSVATMQRYSGVLNVAGAVLVGGLVAALVSSQIRRRVREIGLLAAIGAPPDNVARLFTWQAALAGAGGGLAGWSLAIPATRWLGTTILGEPVVVPAGLLLPSVALAAIVSFIAAYVPARRAAKLDPTVVLRET